MHYKYYKYYYTLFIQLCIHTTTLYKIQGTSVHINKWASWHRIKHHQSKLQVMTTMSASKKFALVDGRTNTTNASCR